MGDDYKFTEDAALKEEASLELENSEIEFVEYDVEYEFVKECTDKQLETLLK